MFDFELDQRALSHATSAPHARSWRSMRPRAGTLWSTNRSDAGMLLHIQHEDGRASQTPLKRLQITGTPTNLSNAALQTISVLCPSGSPTRKQNPYGSCTGQALPISYHGREKPPFSLHSFFSYTHTLTSYPPLPLLVLSLPLLISLILHCTLTPTT